MKVRFLDLCFQGGNSSETASNEVFFYSLTLVTLAEWNHLIVSFAGKCSILIKKPILANGTEEKRERRSCWDTKTLSTYAAPQKKTKTIFCSHSIYSSCYTSESCHQHFLDINQCQDQRGEEEEKLRGRALLNLTKSNTWIMAVLAAWGTAAGSRRQGATSNSLLWSGTVSPHMALISGCSVSAWEPSAFPAVRRCLNNYAGN